MNSLKQLINNFKIPCEKDTHCCMVVPLKSGMQILAVFYMIFGVLALIKGILSLFVNIILGIIINLLSFITLYSGYLWLQWWRTDTQETTYKLLKFQKLIFLLGFALCVVSNAVYVVNELFSGHITAIVPALGSLLIDTSISWYFFSVVLRYYRQNYGNCDVQEVFEEEF